MVKLITMTQEEFQTYLDEDIQKYAEEHVKAGNWAPAEALEKSRSEHNQLLPDGLNSKNQHLFTILDETSGQRVGLLWLEVKTDAPIPSAFIYDFIINEDRRGMGYGTQTLKAAEEWLKPKGIKQISLHVFGHNKIAQELYKKAGFEITGIFMCKNISG